MVVIYWISANESERTKCKQLIIIMDDLLEVFLCHAHVCECVCVSVDG